MLRGLDYATSLLGDEYKDLKPLMTAIQFVHGQQPNEVFSVIFIMYVCERAFVYEHFIFIVLAFESSCLRF